MEIISFLGLGLIVGILSGIIGIGGGVFIIPALVFIFKMPQQMAQGTTLALLVPPIGILAAWEYYRHGYVDLRVAGLICAGFVLGGLAGAKIATALPAATLKRVFGCALILIGIKMTLGK